MRPSGRMTNRPSYPIDPPTKQLEETPTPRTLVPLRFGRAIRSFHWNCSAPRSNASFRNALVAVRSRAVSDRSRPALCLPGSYRDGSSTWSSPSLRAALETIVSMITIPCIPPGELCAPAGECSSNRLCPASAWQAADTTTKRSCPKCSRRPRRRTGRCCRSRTCRAR